MSLGVFNPKLSRIMPVAFHYIWILPFCMGTMISVTVESLNVVSWNRSNPMFQEEGGARITVPVQTNLEILCPCNTTPPEYYRIYWVSEEGFKRCFLPHNDSKLMVDCTTPNKTRKWVQEIQTFSGVPGGKDFAIGHSYYLATFSTGTQHGLLNEIDGACKDFNLRLNVTIANQSTPSTPRPTNRTVSTTIWKSTPTQTTKKTVQTTSSTTTSTTQFTTIKPTTVRPRTTDIPDLTDIPVISVPDTPKGNTGVIDISSAQTLRVSSALVLSLCLSLLHILYLKVPLIQR